MQKPDDTVPQYNGSDLQGYGRWLARGAAWFERPDWLAIATAEAHGQPPAVPSRVLPDAGAFLLRDGFGRDHRGVAGPVVDHHRLAEGLLHMFADQPRQSVGGRAGAKADQNTDRARRIALGRSGRGGRDHSRGK